MVILFHPECPFLGSLFQGANQRGAQDFIEELSIVLQEKGKAGTT